MQDSSVVAGRKLDCFIYALLGEDLLLETHEEALKQLENWQFNVSPTYRKCSNIEEVIEYIEYWETRRFELPLETDGIVVKVNSYSQQKPWDIQQKARDGLLPTNTRLKMRLPS